ncbi:MAG: four helix bundle protein [bacterium]|nr:four helix bundle protein [bacterium]
MARYEHIKIFQSAYILTIEVYRTTKNFSREFKYTLGEKLKNSCHELLDIIRKANFAPDKEKEKYFPEIDFKKENLRVYLRIARDLELISPGRLGVFNEKIEEIGRQLGGWQKYVAEQIHA